MADKVERWIVCSCNDKEKPLSDVHILRYGTTEQEKAVATLTHIHKERASLICALHNAVLDINPSNPMAVAEGLGELVEEAQEWVDSEFGRPRGLRGRMMVTLAAITKPKEGE